MVVQRMAHPGTITQTSIAIWQLTCYNLDHGICIFRMLLYL